MEKKEKKIPNEAEPNESEQSTIAEPNDAEPTIISILFLISLGFDRDDFRLDLCACRKNIGRNRHRDGGFPHKDAFFSSPKGISYSLRFM